MPKIARGRGTGASSPTSPSAYSGPSADAVSPAASRSATVPEENATTRSPRTSPARASPEPGGRKGARRMDGHPDRPAPPTAGPVMADDVRAMESGAIKAGVAASTTSYRSFADATRSVLDLLTQQLPDVAVFLAHLDRSHDIHRIVDTRNGGEFGLRSNLAQ